MSESVFERPAVTPFVECPNCKQLLEADAELCPRCREEIDPEYAFASAVIVHHNTQAISLANTIKTGEPATLIIFFSSLFGYLLSHPAIFIVNLLTSLLWMSAILLWFYRFGRFRIGDEEYLRAKSNMWASLKLWLALISVQVFVVLYMLKSFFH